MTVTVQKDAFSNAIRAVKTSVAKIALQPALSTIHIKSENGGLTLTATDLETSARAVCEANATEPIDVCVNANSLDSIVARLSDLITLEVKEAKLLVKSGKTKFELLFIQPDDFPQVTFEITGNGIVISKDDFISGVNKALVSTSTDVQGILSGVCFTFSNDCYELASTDGNRLNQIKFTTPIGQEGQVVIPKKILQDVIRNVGEDVSIFLNDKTVVFQTGTCLFKQNLLVGKFPEYTKLLPTTFEHRAIVDRNDLLHSLDRVAVMCDEKSNLTIFNFKDGELHLNTASENGTAEDTLEVSFDGALKIAFNYKFILGAIKTMTSETIEFGMNGALGACCITGDEGYLALIMPVNKQ